MSSPDTPSREEHRLRAIADMIGAEQHAAKSGEASAQGIVQAINGLTSAMLALSAAHDHPPLSVADLQKRLSDPEAKPTDTAQPVDRGEAIDYDGAGPARWMCETPGCRARREPDPWGAHIHLVERCTDRACPDIGQLPHAHKSRDNITRITGHRCDADECTHAAFEHAHWFDRGSEIPGDPRWIVTKP